MASEKRIMFSLLTRSSLCTLSCGKGVVRSISNAFLGNELQKDLKQFYLLVHPDVMSSFPDNVKEMNKTSLQVGVLFFSLTRC